jgi:hypothetical protein
MFYMIKAEKMSAMLLDEVVQGIQDQRRGYVYAHGMDSVFTGFANMIVEAQPGNVDAIQAMFHDQNDGAYCEVRKMSEEELDQYL